MMSDSSRLAQTRVAAMRPAPGVRASSGFVGALVVGYSARTETFRCSIQNTAANGELMADSPLWISNLGAMGIALAAVISAFFVAKYCRPSRTSSAPQDGPAPTAIKQPPAAPTEHGELTILCVHNAKRAYKALAKKLQARGIALVGVCDAETAYLACFSEKPGAILIDSTVSNADCRRILERVRAHPFVGDIPAIVVEKRHLPESVRRMAALDGLRRLTRPIDVNALIDELSGHTTFRELAPQQADETSRDLSTGDVAADSPTEPTAKRRPKVLCIDDDPNLSKSIMARLRPYGVDVVRAVNGMQEFWTGLDTRPDVIIIDLKMPDGDGSHIFHRFQSHPLTEDVPVIVLAGDCKADVKRTMLAAGAVNFFTKPWIFDELLLELGRHIELRPADSRQHAPAPF